MKRYYLVVTTDAGVEHKLQLPELPHDGDPDLIRQGTYEVMRQLHAQGLADNTVTVQVFVETIGEGARGETTWRELRSRNVSVGELVHRRGLGGLR